MQIDPVYEHNTTLTNAYISFESGLNVNLIKLEQVEKIFNEDGSEVIGYELGSIEEASLEENRESMTSLTILFTTFAVTTYDVNVNAHYFSPYGRFSTAVVSIYKKEPYQDFYQYLCTLKTGEYYLYDYNIVNNGYYHYLASAMIDKGQYSVLQRYRYYMYEMKVDTETTDVCYIQPRWNEWSICNIYESEEQENNYEVGDTVWKLGSNMEIGDFTHNYGITSWETLGKYSQQSYGVKNYISGTFSGLLGSFKEHNNYNELEEKSTVNNMCCTYGYGAKDGNSVYTALKYTEKEFGTKNSKAMYARETDKLNSWKDFITDGEIKLLRDIKGNAFIIQVLESPTFNIDYNSNIRETRVSFTWKEVEDIEKNSIIGF